MINFSATQQGKGQTTIEFVDQDFEIVKTYQLAELEDYVLGTKLNVNTEMVHVSGSGMPCDPNNVEEEVEVVTDLAEYMDKHWYSLCEDFYNHLNPSGYKANGHPNQLNSKKL